jgi:hypothetical protein
MKPTLQQMRNSVLAAIPYPPDELFTVKGFFPPAAETGSCAKAMQARVVDRSSAYGCVDWYLYPDSKPESATT